MNIMQLIAGASNGGAEAFFTRLVPALHADGMTQTAVIRKNSKRAQTLQQVGIDTYQLPYGGMLDFYTTWRVKQLAVLKRPDIVMSWMNRASNTTPAGKWISVGRLGGYYNLKYYRKCNYLICNTRDIRDYVIKQGWPEKNAHYISNFVDEENAGPVKRNNFNTPTNTPLVLAAGRLHENKGFDVLIRAIATLDNVYLWVAGEGPLKNDLKKLVSDLKLDDRVQLLGWREDINALLASADIFVCPSRHEPLGNVVLEAWAQKIPIIATAAQGPKQLIDDGENGLLVAIDDYSTLAEKISCLIRENSLRKMIIDNGHQKYLENFSQNKIVEEYKIYFSSILN